MMRPAHNAPRSRVNQRRGASEDDLIGGGVGPVNFEDFFDSEFYVDWSQELRWSRYENQKVDEE